MDRRRFLLTTLAGALAAPLAAGAQQAGKIGKIGIVFSASPVSDLVGPEPRNPLMRAFLQGLREKGYVDGRNVVIELRSAEGKVERFSTLVAELVALQVDVIVAPIGQAIFAAKRATTSIPIVMVGGFDPVGTGLVASLARPGGNITGLSWDAGIEQAAKRLEILKEIAPRVQRLAYLWNPTFPGMEAAFKQARLVAPTVGLALEFVEVTKPGDIESAFASILKVRADALFVILDGGIILTHQRQIVDFSLANRLPTISPIRGFTEAGGLVSYDVSFTDLHYRAATFVDKILKGAKPGDLPVEQPTKFELVINLKTAKALGLTIPRSLLLRADQVIE